MLDTKKLLAIQSWCLKNSAVSTVIPGCMNPSQVAANAAAADLEIG